jgi:hypothetical protein
LGYYEKHKGRGVKVAINSWHARYVTNEDDKWHMCP